MGAIYNSYSASDDIEYILMCNTYMDYIKEHVMNVVKFYNEFFVNKNWTDKLPEWISKEDWEDAISKLYTEVQNHDKSKYSDEEFEPYRRHFDKTTAEELADKSDESEALIVEEEYQKAWKHHYLINPHHPEFWAYTDIVNGTLIPLDKPREKGPRDMDLLSILHMICDWGGMTIKFRNKYSPISWYNTEAKEERACMSENTKKTLNAILAMLFPDEEIIE